MPTLPCTYFPFAFAIAATLLPSYASAFSEEDFLSDIPEVASATRISQPLDDVPVATSLITRQIIEASGMIEIPELLRLVPGFQVYPTNHNKYAVTYHGESSEFPNDLEVRINGRPVYVPLLSTVDWNSLGITLDDIEYIEVVRGSNVPSYGSNALMGAINIVTRSPISQPQNRVTFTAGPDKRRDYTATLSNQHENAQYRLSLSGQKNNGFDFQRDGEEVYQGNLQVTLTPTLYDTFDFSAGFSQGSIVTGQGELSQYDDRDHISSYQHLQWKHESDPFNEYTLQLFHNFLSLKTPSYWASDLLGDPGLQQLNAQLAYLEQQYGDAYPFPSSHVSDFRTLTKGENGSVHVYGGELQLTQRPTTELTLASGVGFRYEDARSDSFIPEAKSVHEENYYAFSNIEWQQTAKLLWNLGVMAEFKTTTDDPAISVRGGANYHIDDTTTVRASLTQAFRTPSLLEQNAETAYVFPEGVPFDYQLKKSDQLKSEKLDAVELGLFLKHPTLHGFTDIKLFFEDSRDGIEGWFFYSDLDLATLAQGYPDEERQLRNSKDYRNRGVEVQTFLQPTPKDLINLAYSYNDISGVLQRGDIRDHKPDRDLSAVAPKHTLSLLYNRRFSPTFDAGFILTHMSKVQWEGSSLHDDFTSLDVKFTQQFPISSGERVSATLMIENLWDAKYSEFHRNNAQERKIYLILSLDF